MICFILICKMFDMVSLHTQWYKERDIPDPNYRQNNFRNIEFNPQIFYTQKT